MFSRCNWITGSQGATGSGGGTGTWQDAGNQVSLQVVHTIILFMPNWWKIMQNAFWYSQLTESIYL